jgi:hypothetical protein
MRASAQAVGRTAHLAAVLHLACVALLRCASAQGSEPSPLDRLLTREFLSRLHIDSITEDATGLALRYRPIETDGSVGSGTAVIGCLRGSSGKNDMLVIHDFVLRTDDRWGVKTGFCDALLAAARERKDTQER